MQVKRGQTLVIGVGNEYRGDDGAGAFVARQLESRRPGDVSIRIESGEGASLMEAWRGYDRVYVVDAASGSSAGRIHRFDAGREPIPTEFFHYSTHAFSLAEAVELSRALGDLPADMVVFGIEGRSFASGLGLSDEVQQAAQEVVRRIDEELQNGAVTPCTKCP